MAQSRTPIDLSKDEAHLWSIHMDDDRLCLECCRDALSSEERERASRFKFEIDRRRYIVAHGALRSILASYLRLAPGDLRFSVGSNGKPRLASTPAGKRLEFNLSHSHAMSLVAVIQGREVGVDIEQVREDFSFDEVAERFFTLKEVTALRALPALLQREAFYKCWTSKEAFLKAKGTGLSGALDEVEIVRMAEEVVCIKGTNSNWSLVQLGPLDGYVGALAVEGAECRLKFLQWLQPTSGTAHRHS